MFSSRLRPFSSSCLAVLLCSTSLAAQSPAPSDSPRAETATGAADAVVVLVGEAGDSAELRALLVEFLERRNVHAELVRQAQFKHQELLGASRDHMVHVFVVSGPGLARLYFRDPDGVRFLLREVELRNGLDEVGRELIGQIVESSVDALLHSAVGITREEAQTALEKQAAEPATVPEEPAPRARPAAPRARARGPELKAWCALRYAAEWTGDPGLGHGPGLELGFGTRGKLLVRGRLFAERWFEQSVEGAAIGADIVTDRARLALDLGFGLGPSATLVVSVGAGADLLRVEPGHARDPNVVPAATSSNAVPAARGEVRFETGGSRWQIALAASADASLADTHYDLTDGTTVQRVAEEWGVRPGASVAIGWRPSF